MARIPRLLTTHVTPYVLSREDRRQLCALVHIPFLPIPPYVAPPESAYKTTGTFKIWRTRHPPPDIVHEMLTVEQNSARWHAFRTGIGVGEGEPWAGGSTGSSDELATMCGWSKYQTNISLFEVHIGLAVTDPPNKFGHFCMTRGHMMEDTVTAMYAIVMCAEVSNMGIRLHSKFPNKHTSPDAKSKLRPGVFHSLASAKDSRTGYAEAKAPICRVYHDIWTILFDNRCDPVSNNCKCKLKSVSPIGGPASYIIQQTDQLTVERSNSATPELLHWNDLSVYWEHNEMFPPHRLDELPGWTMVSEFTVLRVYFSPSLSAFIYDYFQRHVAAVRAAQRAIEAGQNVTYPALVKCPAGQNVTIIVLPMKQVLFYRRADGTGEVEAEVRSFWDAKPLTLTLADFDRKLKDGCKPPTLQASMRKRRTVRGLGTNAG